MTEIKVPAAHTLHRKPGERVPTDIVRFPSGATVMPQPTLTPEAERGMALVSVLMASTMLLALGMALVSSATTDLVTCRSTQLGGQAFFVADAGIGIARRAMEKA